MNTLQHTTVMQYMFKYFNYEDIAKVYIIYKTVEYIKLHVMLNSYGIK